MARCCHCEREYDTDTSDAADPDTYCSGDCEDEAIEDGEVDDE